MKIRNGFVSNSSSSSFILSFNEHPSNKETLKKELFGDQKILNDIYDDSVGIDVDTCVEYIYPQIANRSCATRDELIDEFEALNYKYSSTTFWEEDKENAKILAIKLYEEFIEKK